MSERDLSMLVSYGEWEDLEAEVDRLQAEVDRLQAEVEELTSLNKALQAEEAEIRDKWFIEELDRVRNLVKDGYYEGYHNPEDVAEWEDSKVYKELGVVKVIDAPDERYDLRPEEEE